MGQIVNKVGFAHLVGYSDRQVSEWIKEGMPCEGAGRKGSPVKIDTAEAIEWLCKRRLEKNLPEQTGLRSRNEEEVRLITARADKVEAEYQLLRQETCRVEDARQAMLGVGSILVSELGSLPGRLAHVMQETDDPGEAREQLDDECRRVRIRIADRLEAAGRDFGAGQADKAAAEADGVAVG